MTSLYYGFLDESGILEKKARGGGYFIVSVVVVANPVEIKNVMKIARRKARGKFKTHAVFHASKESEGFIKLVLTELVKKKVEIVIGAWDKRRKKGIEKNELYRKLIGQTVRLTFKLYPKLNLVIHKRYTNPKLQVKLHDSIVKSLKKSGFIAISQQDERQRKELELADAVAWAVFQKYNRKKTEFYEIIKKKIRKESRLAT